ncbi:MAG TPA: patatin-like phospholipase family protein, partial [Pyrinomonadaceae bacterium]|nr:patatin-like phospholipase family protein [Pyrinomonadaceae bacterium]
MPKNPGIPLYFYQVLEEEYVSLHGPIPADEEILNVYLPSGDGDGATRLVKAALDWNFHEGHLKDPAGFAADLLQTAEVADDASPDALIHLYDELARKKLRAYIRAKIDAAVLKELAERGQGEHAAQAPLRARVAALEEALNGLLKDKSLYDSDRFPRNWLRPASSGLVRLHESHGGFEDEALKQFNRLLLEVAFPSHIEKINDIRLAAVYLRFHREKPTALSLSGGGIRSGTFALGLIQGLARHNLLKKFDYLSTVSGGGYMGSWLTAWIHRHPKGLGGVTIDLANSDPKSKIDPDPRPLQNLREYSNFITPKVGLLTADTWTFVGIYLRNLLLNWVVFIPLLMAVLMIPRLAVTLTLWQPVEEPGRKVEDVLKDRGISPGQVKGLDQVSAQQRIVYPLKGGVTVFGKQFVYRDFLFVAGFLLGVWALGYIGFNRPGVRELLRRRSRFWRDRADQGSFLLYCLLPLVLSALLLTLYWAWLREVEDAPGLRAFVLFGVAFTFAGWLIASLVLRRFHWSELLTLELLAILLAGALGGFLFWLLSLFAIGDPVIGYGIAVRDGSLLSVPLAWTDWTAWTWVQWKTEVYVCFAVPIFLLVVWAGTTLFVGLTSIRRDFDDQDREWWARFAAWLLIAAIVWSIANVLVIFGPLALLDSPRLIAAVGGLSGLLSILVGRSAL